MKVKYKTLYYISMLIYFCALSGHGRMTSSFDENFQVVSFFIFVAGTVFMIFASSGDKVFYIKLNGMVIWYLCFMAFAFLSFFWAVYSRTAVFFYSKRMIQLVVLLFCASQFTKTEKDIEDIMHLLVFSYIYASLLIIVRTPISSWGTERMGFEIGIDPNLLGTRMAVGTLIALYFFIKYKKKYYIAMIADMAVVTMFSGSKKGAVILIVGACLVEILCTSSKKIEKIFFRILVAFVILYAVWYAIFNIDAFYKVIGVRIERTLSYFGSGGQTFDNSTAEREYYISQAKILFKNHPLIGIGLDNFKSYMSVIHYNHVAYSHNNYWELLSCLGILGTAIFYSFHALLLYRLSKVAIRSRSKLHLFSLIILVIYVVCDYANVSYMNIIQYAVIGLAYMSLKVSLGDTAREEHRIPNKAPLSLGRL